MNIETALTAELETITELQNKIYPHVAPEGTNSPYVVYANTNTQEEYVLDGTTGNQRVIFDINLYCKSYADLKTIGKKVRDKLLSCFQRNVGGFFIQSVNLEMRDFYDSTVDLHRTVFEFEIYY
jgi:hypothetical protein